MPQRLLVPERLRTFAESGGIHRGRGKTGARIGRRPDSGMMHCQMPTTGAAHRKAADRASIRIYRIMLLHMLHRLDHIDFTGKFERIAESSTWMEDKGIFGRELPSGSLPIRDELQFGEMIVPAMEPDIEPMTTSCCDRRPVAVYGEAGRHDEPVRLDGSIDFGEISAHHQSRRARPWRLSISQRASAVHSLTQ